MNTIFDLSEEGRINAINFLSMLGVKFDHDDTYKVVEEANARAIPELFEKAVRCESYCDYLIIKAMFLRAGAGEWPWHSGYKNPASDIHECPYYGWEHAGFMKHIFKPSEVQVISLGELISIVMRDKGSTHAVTLQPT
ncbi:MAG: hypothetical protein CMF37_14770 [Leeuwenhoekiella sp.]|nr:hypothetical protein [Leeuwenhoekiella sp.]MBQ50123.1 hypothetical protein [Leeuwenhoekiella sp.]MBQ50320.1 hypothetical protein [Leeuwenhoekiella sp.]MBQ50517.1 hypothetical protein [Leeuwenhoekiella sp.]|tara:strand:+ start:1143 stop:1556 length:414 start_codon:yes stop_codon:yes gene_type:complete